ncbi:PstS family phosphate ABC transporter substrate-binding protein [Kitasatospora purpeofusca]|uniref:PstS family phosphate ABC transporter substrate-binding protein n=1 Tax=Kitasatospora purpeofusca TaxID=67352 RepID=UPI002A5A3710|nr:substrate-binding domain-containing protein [Kitasatospora purpeofusca]MDY0811041.1 substrate-binding domain-containing protein [Kitasatospora purpeofusca]
MRRTTGKLLAVAALAGSLAATTAGPALADPPAVPLAQDIVGVGSHTTGPLLNAFSAAYDAYLTGLGDTTSPRLRSWDATGPSPITTKAGAPAIIRPYDVGTGLAAFHAVPSGIDFVRADRGPQVGDPTTDLFVALAKDAVSWTATNGGHAPANLSAAQLKGIYSCAITNWQQIDPSLANATIKPFLPTPGSGTRSVFLTAIGNPTSGPCVTNGLQENQGTDPVLNDPDAVFPYSVGHYVGQVYYGRSTTTDAPGRLTVRNINGIAAVNPTAQTINPTFTVTAFGRLVSDVVRQADWTATDAHGQALRNVFGNRGWICGNSVATALIRTHGFLTLPPAACGSTSHS